MLDATAQTFRVAKCVRLLDADGGRYGIVELLPDGGAEPFRADCLDHVSAQVGDLVLVVAVQGHDVPVVLGTLGKDTAALRLQTGYVARGEGSRLVLRDEAGNVRLQVETAGDAPTVQSGDNDLELQLKGRLRVAAKSIELQSTLGDVRIKANDEVLIDAERIRLN